MSTEATGDPMTPAAPPATPAPLASPPAQPTLTSALPSHANTAPAQPSVDLSGYEARVRHFQAEADRAKQEAAGKAAEAEAFARELAALKTNHQAIVEGNTQATRAALERIQLIEQQLEQERANRTKAELLMAHPELVPYAAFIPASTDKAALETQFGAFAQARAQDLEAVRAAVSAELTKSQAPAPGSSVVPSYAQPPTSGSSQPGTGPSAYPPGTYVPSASVARPAAGAGIAAASPDAPDRIQEMMQLAMRESLDKRDPSIFERAQREAIAIANAHIAAQQRA